METLFSTGHTFLDQSAIAALSKWRFHPGLKEVRVPVNFTLQGVRAAAASVGKLYMDAQAAFSRYNYDETIRLTSLAIQQAPSVAALRELRGAAYYRKGDADRAIADRNEAIRLRPNFASYYMDRGTAYNLKGLPDKALAHFKEAIHLEPNNARAYCDRADVEDILLNEHEKALEDYNRAIRLDPNFQRAYYNRGGHFASRHEYARAIADFSEAIRLHPDDLSSYASRAAAYARSGDHSHAVPDAAKAVKMKPSTTMYRYRGTDLQMRAHAYEILGKPALAIRDLREGYRQDSNDPHSIGALAVSGHVTTCSSTQWARSGRFGA